MGLCKCPQRKVTNIFCYEHRVNVCEFCLMHNHPKCVVDTYRNWITDSVFSSKCELCDEELVSGETVRLLCFHIVHWDCLDAWARALPPTTAPAGFSCPICNKMCVFPARNQISPIADALRTRMGQVNWARLGLGLPLLDATVAEMKSEEMNGIPSRTSIDAVEQKTSDIPDHSFEPSANFSRSAETHLPQPYVNQSTAATYATSSPKLTHHPHYSTNQNHFYADSPAPSSLYTPNPRKTLKTEFGLETPLLIDDDDHKYRRRSAFESLSRWIRNSSNVKNKRGRKRTALYVIVGTLGVVLLLMFLFGRSGEEEDGFNPEANPHVIIGVGPGFAGKNDG